MYAPFRATDSISSLVRAVIATGLSKFNAGLLPAAYARRQWDDRNVDLVLPLAWSWLIQPFAVLERLGG
jgi:hypothetical protein